MAQFQGLSVHLKRQRIALNKQGYAVENDFRELFFFFFFCLTEKGIIYKESALILPCENSGGKIGEC